MSKWETVKLGEVCEVHIGKTPSRDNRKYWDDGENMWLSISDMNTKYLKKTREQITQLSISECNMRLIPIDTVVMSFKLSVGKVGITKSLMYSNEAIAQLPIKNENNLFRDYLYYALGNLKFNNLDRAAKGLTLNKKKLFELEFPLPPLEVQKQIAQNLDTVSELLALRKKKLEELDGLIKSVFYDIFGDPVTNDKGWNYCSMGKTIKVIEAGWSVDGAKRQKEDDEKAVLKVSAVTSGYFRETECKVLDKDLIIKKYIFPHKGDLLFSRANTRDLVGATCVIFNDYPDLLLPDKLWRIEFNCLANVFYIKYILSDNSIRGSLSNVSTGTSGSMYNVSMEKFKSIRIPLPPIELQNQFASIVIKIEEQKALVKQSIEETQQLFDSLMSQYFD